MRGDSSDLDSTDQFIRRVLHDLKAPARHVRMFTAMLRESLPETALDESSRESLDVIERAAIQMQDTITSLGAFLRLPSEPGRFQSVDVQRLVENCWMTIRDELDIGGASFEIEGAATIETDAALLSQILGEAIRNAVRYRKPTVPLRLNCTVSADDNLCRIRITDTGVGIDPRYLEKVIEPFERLPSKNVRVGAGLGLALCRRGAELLGGNLSLSSDGESGTTFELDLPSPGLQPDPPASGRVS